MKLINNAAHMFLLKITASRKLSEFFRWDVEKRANIWTLDVILRIEGRTTVLSIQRVDSNPYSLVKFMFRTLKLTPLQECKYPDT
jgi:hypothetical protein